jgi:hypothetical protein
MTQWCGNSTDSVRKFDEVARGEDSIFQEIEQKRVYVRPDGFHRIERKRIAIALVPVQGA